MAKPKASKTRRKIFHSRGSISIIWFLDNVKVAYNTNGIHEETTVWLFIFFCKNVSANSSKHEVWS